MALEKSQIKFAKSKETGEVIGFVSRHSKNQQLRGVRETSRFGKKICVLAENLKGKVELNVLYDVELKQMHNGNGYVVVSATPVTFRAEVKYFGNPEYHVTITFGNKTIFFDPQKGKTKYSRTVEGVIEDFKVKSEQLLKTIQEDEPPH